MTDGIKWFFVYRRAFNNNLCRPHDLWEHLYSIYFQSIVSVKGFFSYTVLILMDFDPLLTNNSR
jgi:hypothetical protein